MTQIHHYLKDCVTFLGNVLSAETKPLRFLAFMLHFLNKLLKNVDNESAIK